MPKHARSSLFSPHLAGLLVICLIGASLAAPGCSKEAGTDQQGAAANASAGRGSGAGRGGRGAGGGGAVPVVTARAVAKAVPVTIPAVGTAEPLATVQIRSQITGQLSEIHFREGQDVRKGAPLFTLDARPFQAALQQAQAVLARDTAQAKNAQSQRARYEDLFNRGLIPRDQYETQTANASALEATLAADQAQIENARLNLQYTRILAPISGRTGALGIHQGDLVRANDTTVVVIQPGAPSYVTFSVPPAGTCRHPPLPGATTMQSKRASARWHTWRAAARTSVGGQHPARGHRWRIDASAGRARCRGDDRRRNRQLHRQQRRSDDRDDQDEGDVRERGPRALAWIIRAGYAGAAHGPRPLVPRCRGAGIAAGNSSMW